MKKISVSKYNELFHIAESSLQSSWRDLGLTEEETKERSDKNQDLQKMSKETETSPVYCLYKKNANEVVDSILKSLNIEVEE